MRDYDRLGLTVGVLTCALACSALGNGFRNPPEGAVAMGRAGGKVTDVDDVSAIAINPANLATLSGPQVQGGATFVFPSIEFTDANGRTSETEGGAKILPSVFGAMPLSSATPLVLGLGLSSPWGQSTEWAQDSAVASVAPYFARLITVNANPTLSSRIGKHVLAGVGLDLMQAELDLRQWIALGPGAPPTHIRLNGDGHGVGGNAGMTVELPRNQRLSATYRSPIDVDLDGDMDVSGFTGPLAASSDFKSKIRFPASATAGYGVSLAPDVRVGVDIEWIEFSTFDTLPLDLGANSAVGLFPPAIPEDWKDIWTYGIGAAWNMSQTLTARAGCVYLETPIPVETLAPTLADDNRFVYSVGLGHHKAANALDVAYAYSTYERSVGSNLNPAFLGSYDVEVHLVQASFTHTF